ncbi:hypothetical protein AB0B54_01250 [Microbispora bryophytorum]|uniref:hypothetical protein n=1 Tax=Microbispora bryophytorum TaxID=1460882 RepID=UPI003403CB23
MPRAHRAATPSPRRADHERGRLIGRHPHAPATAWQELSAWQGTTGVGIESTNEVWGRIALTEMAVHGVSSAHSPGKLRTEGA